MPCVFRRLLLLLLLFSLLVVKEKQKHVKQQGLGTRLRGWRAGGGGRARNRKTSS